MDILYRFKAFILSLFEKIFQLLPRAAAPAPPPPAAFMHHEVVGDQNQREPAAPAADQYNLDWAMIMIGFCLPSAVEIALQSLQTKSQLSPMFHFLSISIILSFTFLFVSKFMNTKFPVSAQVLERVGVLFAVTAIFVAITIPFPLWLNCITWVLYAISFIAIMLPLHVGWQHRNRPLPRRGGTCWSDSVAAVLCLQGWYSSQSPSVTRLAASWPPGSRCAKYMAICSIHNFAFHGGG
ncbi:hypothetical protein Pint_16333 [Pistacia integerrima]|uniref:Uncharacterized protein n=1 Tax=Pistacia integerrima TaxID=434235 RepID=A0ACC0ZEZ7_9ROSI|nr:hypothetical protein Pint_16333 [Pistacia integerrima]